MTEIKQDYLYTETNEWIRVDGDIATIGIDDYSQNEFGEIVYVDLPKVGQKCEKDDDVCVIESVKTASDICSPLSGEVVKVNETLVDKPKLINESCYDKGWLYQLKLSNTEELKDLISPAKYVEYVS
ncbi:glycine cleavage system protein GcvH [Francisella frigiditurris]|uniref:Glycine cleavage system H protein n=1 Tax=Francisella frigiditurris TaxID=1542390 RepID=A0A1J0KU58_9GAMM|nr:glycine cleavage system protein GcvH [Francisella frigiditurris]APC97215.1 glycine cleavage system H protein [Francisella frigiditurris]